MGRNSRLPIALVAAFVLVCMPVRVVAAGMRSSSRTVPSAPTAPPSEPSPSEDVTSEAPVSPVAPLPSVVPSEAVFAFTAERLLAPDPTENRPVAAGALGSPVSPESSEPRSVAILPDPRLREPDRPVPGGMGPAAPAVPTVGSVPRLVLPDVTPRVATVPQSSLVVILPQGVLPEVAELRAVVPESAREIGPAPLASRPDRTEAADGVSGGVERPVTATEPAPASATATADPAPATPAARATPVPPASPPDAVDRTPRVQSAASGAGGVTGDLARSGEPFTVELVGEAWLYIGGDERVRLLERTTGEATTRFSFLAAEAGVAQLPFVAADGSSRTIDVEVVPSGSDFEDSIGSDGSREGGAAAGASDATADVVADLYRRLEDEGTTTLSPPELSVVAGGADTDVTLLEALLRRGVEPRDELLFALAARHEEGRQMREARDLYRELVDDYPLSRHWDRAQERIEYLNRYFLQIR